MDKDLLTAGLISYSSIIESGYLCYNANTYMKGKFNFLKLNIFKTVPFDAGLLYLFWKGVSGMKSIYHRALGEEFHNLHPELQKKYGLTSKQNLMVLGQGRMTEIRGTHPLLRPFLQMGSKDHLVFAERGRDVPFTLENYVYDDEKGRETVSWIRRFFFPYAIRGFDAAMRYDEEKESLVDDLGKSGLMQTELDIHVTVEGGLYMESKAINVNGGISMTAPTTSVYEHYDEEEEAFRIHVHAEHPWLGTLMMYEGTVHTEFLPMTYNNIPKRGVLE
ncbi:protein of unknown function [Halobacillus karajensis]|nr:protein of unknown function [Halobacillus karajensis]